MRWGETPAWYDDVPLKNFADFDWAVFTNLQKLGRSSMNVSPSDSITDVLPGEVVVGDVITIGGQAIEVVSVGPSCSQGQGRVMIKILVT